MLADDEHVFLSATSLLLRNAGFCCDCAQNSDESFEKLAKTDYDLLIADIKMPGNSKLELVRKALDLRPAVSIILLTGFPSQQTAMDAIELSVAAYIIKPVVWDDFMQKVRSAVKTSLLQKMITGTIDGLLKWGDELENIELSYAHGRGVAFETALNGFLSITAVGIDETFRNIHLVAELLGDVKQNVEVCNVMQCRRLPELKDGIKEAIASIKKSREMFKSKQLGKIREKLEYLLEDIK